MGRTLAQTYLGNYAGSVAFDPAGNLVLSQDPLGGLHSATYDAVNRATAGVDPTGAFVTYGYDPVGRQLLVIGCDGSVITRIFDPCGRLSTQLDFDVDTMACWTQVYDFDPRGLRTVRWNGGSPESYSYDALGNTLSQQSANTSATYVYNALGQRVATAPQWDWPLTNTFDPAGHTTEYLQGPMPTTLSLDAVGNAVLQLTGDALTTFMLDGENRLIQIFYPSGVILTNAY